MNLVQDKVKQRNVTPNFLRFRSNSTNIQEKVPRVQSVKRTLKTTKSKHRWLPNVLKEVLPKLAGAALKPTKEGFFILANLVLFFLARTTYQSQRSSSQRGNWIASTQKKSHNDRIASHNYSLE